MKAPSLPTECLPDGEGKRKHPEGPKYSSSLTCDRCGFEVEEVKCKIVCSNCGYYRDCSDP